MTRDTRLVDPGLLDDVADLPFPGPQCLDDAPAGRVSQRLEGIRMHHYVYAEQRIRRPSSRDARENFERHQSTRLVGFLVSGAGTRAHAAGVSRVRALYAL